MIKQLGPVARLATFFATTYHDYPEGAIQNKDPSGVQRAIREIREDQEIGKLEWFNSGPVVSSSGADG